MLTRSQQREKIATLLGWTLLSYSTSEKRGITRLLGRKPGDISWGEVPEYHDDLNAMNQAEHALLRREHWKRYNRELQKQISRDKSTICNYNFHASAVHRVNALLLTLDAELVGSTVRLKTGRASKAKIVCDKVIIGNGIVEGGVFLDKPLNGQRYWNIEDLEIVHSPNIPTFSC
jgi:hypothetical protein